MGTRNLTMVIKDQKTKVAQYGQWDGYPSGQGLTALKFLQNAKNIKKLRTALDKVRFFNDNDYKQRKDYAAKIGAPGGWMTSEQAKKYKAKFPFDSRDHGAEILKLIIESKNPEIALQNDEDFLLDDLYCEWAYSIDLDKNTFNVFKDGKNLIKTYSLNNLPSKEEFLQLKKVEA